jgi:hypothetical protein
VVVAEDAPTADERIIQEPPAPRKVTQRPQDHCEESGGARRDRVILTEDTATAGDVLLEEPPGSRVVT